MERIVQKFSIVFVSNGEKTEVFRSVDEIPTEMRRKLVLQARSSRVETLIIANEKGRELLESQDKSAVPGNPLANGRLSSKMRWVAGSSLAAAVGLVMLWLVFGMRWTSP